MMSYTQSRGVYCVGLLVLLLPIFFPTLFSPLGGHASPSLFSEWNAPKPKHLPLLKGALERKTSSEQQSDIWAPLADQGWKPSPLSPQASVLPKKFSGYVQVFLDGGLNQQRMGICDAVAVAKILNAILVIPHFEVNPVWKDSSSFTEIFDVDHFIDVLKDDVSIVKELPKEYSWSTREYYATAIRATRIKTAPVRASANWYLENVLPVLQSYGIAAIAPFSHRLAFDNMPMDIQRLRCKVNFQALTFVPHVKILGDALVNRLRYPSKDSSSLSTGYLEDRKDVKHKQGDGKFVVLHLRFDKDMAAHSACDFGGGKAEKLALAKYRQVLWQGRVLNSQFTDEELRGQGRCPLTPEEIGLLLAALGFDSNTRLYLASHKVYGGEARISTLRMLFPLMEDKKGLASAEERAKITGKASLLAAVDYYVSMHSDIFISASPGNMHNALILIDGFSLNDLDTKWFRENIGYVGQEPRLFRMDVSSNIRYDCTRDVSQEEVELAAKQAYAHEFISYLPNGYKTLVDDDLLSGGQKQRLAIARAILRDPSILILDEATSALDAESEHNVKGILHASKGGSKKNRTVIVIAHRLSTIQAADQVIVVDEGQVVEMGTHSELLWKNGLYATLINRQAGTLM